MRNPGPGAERDQEGAPRRHRRGRARRVTFPGQAHLPRGTEPSCEASGRGHAMRSLAICSLECFLNTCQMESFADTQCPFWRILAMPPLSPSQLSPAVPAVRAPGLSLSLTGFRPRLASSHARGCRERSSFPMCPHAVCPAAPSCALSGEADVSPALPRERQHSPKPGRSGARPTAGALGPNSATCWLCGLPSLCHTQLYCDRGSSWHPRPDQGGVPQGGQCLAKGSGGSWQDLLLTSCQRHVTPPHSWVQVHLGWWQLMTFPAPLSGGPSPGAYIGRCW